MLGVLVDVASAILGARCFVWVLRDGEDVHGVALCAVGRAPDCQRANGNAEARASPRC